MQIIFIKEIKYNRYESSIFDVDGTLIEGTHPDYRYMRENVQKAIRKLQEQGHYVFIASGRSLAFLDEKIRNFGLYSYR
ncbi:Cof-like hydrolase [Megamonas hypermegale]|uniref:Cof-like hydrolase n=1 Tax=Megamonas hypermegale TaxID=158847 RepID=A0A378NUK8_9FIRM|nr:HAD hydrolase family protein [Megamonas hypermegale]STY72054.1 Cof-like hydrolase [Megamonas hypermegale]